MNFSASYWRCTEPLIITDYFFFWNVQYFSAIYFSPLLVTKRTIFLQMRTENLDVDLDLNHGNWISPVAAPPLGQGEN